MKVIWVSGKVIWVSKEVKKVKRSPYRRRCTGRCHIATRSRPRTCGSRRGCWTSRGCRPKVKVSIGFTIFWFVLNILAIWWSSLVSIGFTIFLFVLNVLNKLAFCIRRACSVHPALQRKQGVMPTNLSRSACRLGNSVVSTNWPNRFEQIERSWPEMVKNNWDVPNRFRNYVQAYLIWSIWLVEMLLVVWFWPTDQIDLNRLSVLAL